MGSPMKIIYRNFVPVLVSQDQIRESMVPKIEITDALPVHVEYMKSNLRKDDANEILRLGMTIQHSLWRGYRESVYRKTALVDGIPSAMWGVQGSLLGSKGRIWLMTSPEVYKVSPLCFARLYQEEVHKMLKIFQRLENFVDSSYTAAIRLLDITGFNIGDPEPIGVNGAMYRRFWIGRE